MRQMRGITESVVQLRPGGAVGTRHERGTRRRDIFSARQLCSLSLLQHRIESKLAPHSRTGGGEQALSREIVSAATSQPRHIAATSANRARQRRLAHPSKPGCKDAFKTMRDHGMQTLSKDGNLPKMMPCKPPCARASDFLPFPGCKWAGRHAISPDRQWGCY